MRFLCYCCLFIGLFEAFNNELDKAALSFGLLAVFHFLSKDQNEHGR